MQFWDHFPSKARVHLLVKRAHFTWPITDNFMILKTVHCTTSNKQNLARKQITFKQQQQIDSKCFGTLWSHFVWSHCFTLNLVFLVWLICRERRGLHPFWVTVSYSFKHLGRPIWWCLKCFINQNSQKTVFLKTITEKGQPTEPKIIDLQNKLSLSATGFEAHYKPGNLQLIQGINW